MRPFLIAAAVFGSILAVGVTPRQAAAIDLIGKDAFGGWTKDAPGVRRLIRPSDLPAPSSNSAREGPTIVPRPSDAELRVPNGFRAALFADGLDKPRLLRVAPNGDIFVSEGLAGRIRVLRPTDDNSSAKTVAIFASGLNKPFGLAFYPRGGNPTHLYVAETDGIVRFPYRNGDLTAREEPEVLDLRLPSGEHGLPGGGHWTRDIVFGPQSLRMFISVGSATNVAELMPERTLDFIAEHEAGYGRGAAWGSETNRAVVPSPVPLDRNFVHSRPDCVTARRWLCIRLVDFGVLRLNGTGSATICHPILLHASLMAAFMGGPGFIAAASKTRGRPESGPILLRTC